MISLENLTLHRGTKVLLENTGGQIHSGQKVALVGANGAGKSSLFQLLLGEAELEAGDVHLPGDWRVAHMAQEVAATGRSAIDYVMDGDTELRAVESGLRAAEDAGDNAALAGLHQRLDEAGGYSARARAGKLLHGLGFSDAEVERPVNSFSGGWRIRLNLAQALMCPSDLLLLDEPTNHLDMDATLWLEAWLCRYPGTLLLISHDRDFIDGVCNQVVQIEHRRLWWYTGNYSAYEKQRAERLAQDQARYEKQQRRTAEIHKFVSRFKAKASKAKQAQSRLKELERMERLEPAHFDSPFDFSFPRPERVSDPLLNLAGGALGYGTVPVLSGVNISVHPGSRVALLGANGAGKSTLIRTLGGELPLLAGERMEGVHLRIGYFSQHQVDSLDLDASPTTILQRALPSASEQSIRDFLGSFNFRGDMAREPAANFSGGEKARLALALIVWLKPNLLLLDEPTNHLDLDMRHALTVALQGFEGAVVLVSHDRHLIRNTVDELLLVNDGAVAPFEGDLGDYSRWLLDALREDRGGDNTPPIDSAARKPDKKQLRQQAAEVRRQLAPLRQQVKALEKRMEQLAGQMREIEQQLADTSLYEADGRDYLQSVLVEQGQLNREMENVENDWLHHLERLEALESASAAEH